MSSTGKSVPAKKKVVEQIEKKNLFAKLDSAMSANHIKPEWVKNVKRPGRVEKIVRLPKNLSLIMYNKLFMNIFSGIGITVDEVKENESRRSLSFRFNIENGKKAGLVVKRDYKIKELFPTENRFCIIIDDFGNQWSTEFVQGYIDFPVPLTLAIIPGNWASKKTAVAAYEKGKETMIHFPMEPLNGSIEKEKMKLLVSMSEDEIEENFINAMKNVPYVSGVNNHEGSKATSTRKSMKAFFNILRKHKLYFIDSGTSSKSVCRDYAVENRIPFAKRTIFLDHENEEEYIEKMFREAVDLYSSGSDVIVIGHTRQLTYEVLARLVNEEFGDLNYVFASEMTEVLSE